MKADSTVLHSPVQLIHCSCQHDGFYSQNSSRKSEKIPLTLLHAAHPDPGGVLDFVLDGGVPPGPRDPNPCLEIKKGTHV